MKTVATMRKYIIEYVKGQPLEKTGQDIIQGYFGVPFSIIESTCYINGVYLDEEETKAYIMNFFQEMDTVAVIDLYHKLTV